MSDRIDIHDPIFDICKRLGLEPNMVKEIQFSPTDVTAIVYTPNDDGHKHIHDGKAATESLMFKVTT